MSTMEESILEYLQRRLKEIDSAHWEALAKAAKVKVSTPRKVAYERKNPGVNTIDGLYFYLKAVDAGEKQFPWDRPAERRSGADRRTGQDRRKQPRAD